MSQKKAQWTVGIMLAVLVCVVIAGIFFDNYFQDPPAVRALKAEGYSVVTQETFGCVKREDVALAWTAMQNHDVAGLGAMLADGRIVKLEAGTKITSMDAGGPLVYITVKSGFAIGKLLYVPREYLR